MRGPIVGSKFVESTASLLPKSRSVNRSKNNIRGDLGMNGLERGLSSSRWADRMSPGESRDDPAESSSLMGRPVYDLVGGGL